ncbi:MAG: zinc ribbon domain-containing protein [Atopobiaceae bacterium]|nr:zinc ribbon domain-containing protein [Atopobiaceae bacterium]
MYCQYCGKQIKDGVKYCTFCGLPQELDGMEDAPNAYGNVKSDVTKQIDPPLSILPEHKLKKRRWALPLTIVTTVLLAGVVVVGAWCLGLLDNLPSIQMPEYIESLPFVSPLVGGHADQDSAGNTGLQVEGYPGSNDAMESSEVEVPFNAAQEDNTITSENPESSVEKNDNTVPVRKGLNEYSWDELKSIAEEIESCTTGTAAMEVAIRYNLVDSSGKLLGEIKDVRLSDGKTMHMRVVGVWHDKADTASGKAGLSFLSDGIVAYRPMHSNETISGGWQSSGMRTWLSSDLWRSLPNEVSSAIVPAYKLTNNSGEARSVSSVTETEDSLWLPSVVEVCGPVDWEYQSNPSNSGLYNSIINAEGSQYLAFSQQSIDNYADN